MSAALRALVEKWRGRERKLCHRADIAPDQLGVYARALAGQAERIAECADELDALLSEGAEPESRGVQIIGAVQLGGEPPVYVYPSGTVAISHGGTTVMRLPAEWVAMAVRDREAEGVEPTPAAEDKSDNFTPEQIAELRQDFEAWLATRQVPDAVRRMLLPWQFPAVDPQEDGGS